MASNISNKLKIKPGYKLLTINAPADFKKNLTGLPANVQITDKGTTYDQVHWFVLQKAQLEKQLSRVLGLLNPDITVWVYYPKKTSSLQTDLSRDKGWDCLLAEDKRLTWINLISFDSTWSVFGFRAKSETDQSKANLPKPEREVFQYADPTTRQVRLPDDLAKVFSKNKQQAAFFDALSFTNKKEYVEWIVTAKKEETRMQRLSKTLEKLGKGLKNPGEKEL